MIWGFLLFYILINTYIVCIYPTYILPCKDRKYPYYRYKLELVLCFLTVLVSSDGVAMSSDAS